MIYPPKINPFIRNVFDFWNNLVLDYSWELVPIGQRFLGSSRLWKIINYEKCQFSPTSLRASRSECSASYDFGLWGDREPIVRYFKDRRGQDAGNMDQLYDVLDIERLKGTMGRTR
jgi:hypothetical protein